MTLLFIAFAQVTTDVLNNVVPPTYILMDVFKLSFRSSAVLVGVLAVATCPWLLVREESAAGLQTFVQTYSAFLGPIFAVMVVDYYVVRGRRLDLEQLYDEQGAFRGVNPAALVAVALGVAVAFTFPAVGWYASLLPAGASYYLLVRRWRRCARFLPEADAVIPAVAVISPRTASESQSEVAR